MTLVYYAISFISGYMIFILNYSLAKDNAKVKDADGVR